MEVTILAAGDSGASVTMTTTEQLNTALAGRYTIERRIGEGGMAVVYLARDLKHQRRVALKVLKPDLNAVLGNDRFLSEIQLTANLQHPNLLPLFDSGVVDQLLFYAFRRRAPHCSYHEASLQKQRCPHPISGGLILPVATIRD